ncbi:MAG: CPF_0552 family protein [Planctomycetota bacterium]
MDKPRHIVLGVHITDRLHHAREVQDLLTEYGCSIKTHVGLHEVSNEFCSPNGLVLLEMAGDEKPIFELVDRLNAVEGVDTRRMVFDHD